MAIANGVSIVLGLGKNIHNSDLPVICEACEARHRGVCGALSAQELTELNKHTRQEKLDRNLVISNSDQKVERFANITRGVVKLSSVTSEGDQQIVGLQFAPDFLGRPFSELTSFEAEAAQGTELCTFPRSILESMIDKNPELEHKLHKQALRELDETRHWLVALGRKTATEKLAYFLYWIAKHSDPNREGQNDLVVSLPLNRSEIADFLGLTIETVSRQFTKLRKAGLIDVVDRRTITVKSLDRLAERADI